MGKQSWCFSCDVRNLGISWKWINNGGSSKQITKYEWQQHEPFILEIREVSYQCNDEPTVYEPQAWEKFRYEFKISPSDANPSIILCSYKSNRFLGSFNVFSNLNAPQIFNEPKLDLPLRKYRPAVSLVNGYLENIDYQSKTAKKIGLPYKYSIAFHTYNPEVGKMYFDITIYELLFREIFTRYVYDEFWVKKYKSDEKFENFDTYITSLRKWNEADEIPIDAIKLIKDTEVILYIETEFYQAFGGAQPYHDSYNFAFYSAKMFSSEFIHANETFLKTNEVEIKHNLSGLVKPKFGFWKRFTP